MQAYDISYLRTAMFNLACCFDYAICECNINADTFMDLFLKSRLSGEFERGNPGVVAGRSGTELAMDILSENYLEMEFPEVRLKEDRSPEFWAGWALAQFQFYTGKRFRDIFDKIYLSDVIKMYPLYHEMDITNFIDSLLVKLNENLGETKLQKARKNIGMSQYELSQVSGVNIRSIQLYEQRVNDIDKAQAHTLYKLAVVLGVQIEDLLESPERDL